MTEDDLIHLKDMRVLFLLHHKGQMDYFFKNMRFPIKWYFTCACVGPNNLHNFIFFSPSDLKEPQSMIFVEMPGYKYHKEIQENFPEWIVYD